MHLFIQQRKYLELPLCTGHWFRPKGYSIELDKTLRIMEFNLQKLYLLRYRWKLQSIL